MNDPTRAELIAFLESQYADVTGGETYHTEEPADCDEHDGCGCRFAIESAAYWLAAHYHGGQSSHLYAALCQSPYRPGPYERDLPDDEGDDNERCTESDLYRAGARWIESEERESESK